MKKQHANSIICFASLLAGGVLYVVFRPNTYISQTVSNFPLFATLKTLLAPIGCDFLRFYFPDFIWCFALGCGLQAIFTRSALLCGFCAFMCGVVWEGLQFWHIVSGTADIWDILLYFCGSALCIILNLKERKQ